MGVIKERDDDLLQAIFDEMQYLKRVLLTKNERRIGRAEFAKLLNIEPETLDARIREGRYTKPYKDGRKSYWLNSYVQSVILDVDSNYKATS
ncbi:hypothetical protein BEN71_10455 [Acinetobacter wuhouensis]|uniref:hypothetical protein n=1 Tax=Acinetobacter wuhouensis TaxID=1879050 RepID=UPI00083B7E54|nr:hypothetical protein [Acinetobacter wuhouensis]AXQ22467.1 hypothetical protein BEN71_10455 [Acinetobacter wuhouensis]